MNTNFALLARFEAPVIPLKEICDEFFGMKFYTATMKIKAQDFPVPTFQLANGQRSPIFVKVEDLAKHIDEQYTRAKEEWQSVQVN